MELDVLAPELTRPAVRAAKPPSRVQKRLAAIRVNTRFEASPERVFDAWLDPGIAGRWLFATASRPMNRVAIDAHVGGAFRFVDRNDGERIEHTGVYVEIARPRRLAFTLSTDNHQQAVTRVVTEIVPAKTGCEVIVTHEDVPAEYADHVEGRWAGMLYGLGETLSREPGD